MSNKQVVTRPGGTPKIVRNATANDSDKVILTVPAGKMIRLENVFIDYTSTATAGNRSIRITITDGTNVIFAAIPVAFQTAGLNWFYNYGIGYPASAAIGNGHLYAALPDIILKAGYVVRVYDSTIVDVAADDMIVVACYTEYEA